MSLVPPSRSMHRPEPTMMPNDTEQQRRRHMCSSSRENIEHVHRHHRCSFFAISICLVLLSLLEHTSSNSAMAFAPLVSTITTSPRSAVIQAYRLGDDYSQSDHPVTSNKLVSPPKKQSDVFSLLPTRLSSIQRMNTPSQFQSHVLEEKESLVVVRFYADACPTCKATSPLFRRWSRKLETEFQPCAESDDSSMSTATPPRVKVVEMPLNKATSTFLLDQLHVEKLPYCHLYHPQFGLVEEKLVMNKSEFFNFQELVDCWTRGECEAEIIDHDHDDYNNNSKAAHQGLIEYELQ